MVRRKFGPSLRARIIVATGNSQLELIHALVDVPDVPWQSVTCSALMRARAWICEGPIQTSCSSAIVRTHPKRQSNWIPRPRRY